MGALSISIYAYVISYKHKYHLLISYTHSFIHNRKLRPILVKLIVLNLPRDSLNQNLQVHSFLMTMKSQFIY